MPDRTQVADLAGPQALQAAAAPVDAYHAPVVPKVRPPDAQIGDLAAALQDIQPSLARFNQTSMQMSMEEGHALAAKNKLQFKEAVDKGIIKPGQNPWLAKGYKEQILALQAQDYDSVLRQAWTKSGASESDDPAVFKKFVDSTTQAYVDNMDLKNDPTFAQAFVPRMVASQANLLDQHTAYRQERIVQQATDATYRNIQSKIDSHYLYADNEHLASDIKQTVDGMVQSGLPGAKANQLTVDAITNKAIDQGDLTVLDLLKHVQTNAGPLDKTQYAQDKIREATQHIFSVQREKDAYEWTNHDRNLKLIGEDLLKQGYTRIGQDPNGDITDLIKQAEAVDPEKAKTLREYQDYVKTQGVKVYEDPKAVGELYSHIYSGTATPSEILSLANSKRLAPDQVAYAFRDMEQASHHRDVLDNPAINRVVSDVDRVITQGGTKYDNESALKSLDAQNTLRRGIIDFREKNPNASATDLYEEGIRIQKIVLQGLPETAKVGTSLPPVVEGRIHQEIGTASAPAPVKPLYKTPDDLKAAIKEYNDTQGAGRLSVQAEALGISVDDLIKAQRAHLKGAAKK